MGPYGILNNSCCVIFYKWKKYMGTPRSKAAVAFLSEEQRKDALVFLECNIKELAGFPGGCGF